ncbi:MAG: PKD domain-containing protein [Chitinophagaceae bacterium]|nr:PKD domain-containing protein [Chitinophagaceae bacterium]
MKKHIFLSALTLLCALSLNATVRKVYFIGNSYTYTNSMPTMLRDLAAANGDTLIFDMSAPGGYTFEQHTTNATTIAGIFAQSWDVVVLQEQSQKPSFSPTQVAAEVYPYATRLDSFINANDTCTETMFMMTWGRKNGDAANCPSYPPVCTYAGMQGRLRESYMQMAQDNDASVAPVGAAWKMVVDSFPTIDLFVSDESHPSLSGGYLQACVFYASIFNKRSMGSTYTGGLPATTVSTLQRIADKVVFDSITQWQQYGRYPHASFTKAHTGGVGITFTNKSQRAGGYLWSFGDTTTDTAANPSHTYAAAGIYTVSLTVKNACFSITIKDTVRTGTTTEVVPVSVSAPSIIVSGGQSGQVTLISDAGAYYRVELYDLVGRAVSILDLSTGKATAELVPGIYFYRAYRTGDAQHATGRFSTF